MPNNMIYCAKLKTKLPALTRQPYPGLLGKKIFEQISAAAWQQWLEHQTRLINEYRLSTLDPKARSFLATEMEKFLFGEGAIIPEGYKPVNST